MQDTTGDTLRAAPRRGLDCVSGGLIAFEGQPIHGQDSATVVRAGLVHVMEGRRVLPHMTVEQNRLRFIRPSRGSPCCTGCANRAWRR